MDETQSGELNIEEIMQEIRQQILAKKDVVAGERTTAVAVSGKRLSPDFYEHLYQAALVHDQVWVKMLVTKSSTPLIGPLLDKLRGLLHELVLFYVNKLAAEQIQFNTHLLQAVNLLAQQLEAEEATDEPEA
jgi:hypothetical protein